MSPPARKRRGSGSKKGKKAKKAKQRRKSTKSSTQRKASYADGETAPFWDKALERVYAQLPMPAMPQGASTAAATSLSSGCSSHDGRKWSSWCSRRILKNKPLEPGVRARADWRSHVAFPKGVTVVSAEAIAEAKAKEHKKKQQASDKKCAKEGLPRGILEPKPEKVLKVRKLRVRLSVEPRRGA